MLILDINFVITTFVTKKLKMEFRENYTRDKITIDLIKANIYSLIISLPVGIIYGVPYGIIWHEQFSIKNIKALAVYMTDTHFLIVIAFFVLFFIGILLHELIHGFVWALYAEKGMKSIKFGVLWKMLTPYCHCKEPLTVKHYITGAIMPAIILGFLPALLGIIIGNIGWLLFGFFFTIAASGDFLIISLVRKERMSDFVQDHPSEAGCYIYRDKNENRELQ